MADIIKFTPRERSGAPSAGTAPAAVIIFPGVRYERTVAGVACTDEPPQDGERPRRRGRRRRAN